MKTILRTAVKIAVSFCLIGFLLYRSDLHAIRLQLLQSLPDFAVLTFAAYFAMTAFQVVRWRLLLAGEVTLGRLLRYHLIASFFQSVLPGGSMEVIKGYLLSRNIAGSRAYGSIAFVKILGIVVLLPLLALILIWKPDFLPEKGQLPAAVGMMLAILLMVLVLFSKRVSRFFFGFFHRFSNKPVVAMLMNFRQVLYEYRDQKRVLFQSVVLSLLNFLVSVLFIYFSFRTVSFNPPLSACFFIVPVVSFFAMLPVSINGIGVREGLLLLLFKPYGLTAEVLLASSVVVYAAYYTVCLTGGVVYLSSDVKGVRHAG
ncbi:MAG: hypothetical protein A2293_01010 [Elusimicrobia bacterium RIFOXYB2_FULL_49_7]|nr:MAG: hypothetical protein A2293_01010 [Elusimicrobia bacterium RIFOXYB2_FULL_49_7]